MTAQPGGRPPARKLSTLLTYLFKEIIRQKRWLLLPVWILLAALALFFFLSSSGVLLPAIYLAF
jgi:hypothetical protein